MESDIFIVSHGLSYTFPSMAFGLNLTLNTLNPPSEDLLMWASEMLQWIEVVVHRPGNLGSIIRLC